MSTEFSASGLSDALVVLGAAGIVIPTFARVRISPVIGFILVGILVGPSGLGAMAAETPWLRFLTISNPEAIEPFAELGIIMLLFAIGLELSFRRLWGMRRLVFGVGAAELVFGAALIGVSIHLLGTSWTGSIALGLALALSSTAVVLPLVGTSSPVGRSAFAMLLFEDLAIVPIIFGLGALAPRQQGDPVSGLVTTLIVGGAVVVAMLVLGRILLPRLFAQAARTKSPEMFLSISLLVVITASLATAAAGLSPIVGALIAGILIAETEYHGEVEIVTAPFRGLGLGVFLISVGMSLDLRFILGAWPQLLLALVGVMLAKTAVTAFLLMRLGGSRRAVAAEVSLLMASPSETTLIVLAAAAAAGLIGRDIAGFWQIVTAMGLTLTPLLAKLGRFAGRQIEGDGGGGISLAPSREEPRAVILGFGRVGRLVAEMLSVHGRPYVAIDSNIDAVTAARREGFPMIFGDASRPDFLDRLNLGHASALILTMDDPVQVVRLVRKVRSWCPGLTIVARARDAEHAAELYKAGASDAVPETLESSLQLSEAVLVDLGIAMGPVIASIHEKRAELRQQIMEMGQMAEAPPQRGQRLRDRLGKNEPEVAA
ncbi:cation:proton antiporter [Sphingosinicella terrae]|uniref:cation:proton antiporter domain-containing protein n=1 Tax=Sphingosinicella terrae TaxID=2172047 RepID=UPI000E0D8969|nr:cation:proton antiporter [Sphingosinicella terrae]